MFSACLQFLAILAFALIAGCAAESNAPTTAPRLCVPATVSFDEVKVGDSKPIRILLQSCGTDSVIVSSQLLGGSAFTFTNTADRAFRLGVTDSHYVTIRFNPSDTIPYFGFDTIVSSAGSVVVRLFGQGISARIPPTPGPHLCVDTLIEFDDVNVGDTSTMKVQLVNCGDATLVIKAQSIVDKNFFLQSARVETISAGSTDSVLIRFAPRSAGSLTGHYMIWWDSVTSVTLHGFGK